MKALGELNTELIRRVKDMEAAIQRQDSEIITLRELNAELLSVVNLFMDRMLRFGDEDEGCFYYSKKAASELQEPINKARLVIVKAEQLK
jgi:hypothetical protein